MEEFEKGTKLRPNNRFSLAMKYHEGFDNNRLVTGMEKTLAKLGGMNNLVFYKNSDASTTEIKPYSIFREKDLIVVESVLKVKDLSLVADEHKGSVEVE